jgi:hypothetical protein
MVNRNLGSVLLLTSSLLGPSLAAAQEPAAPAERPQRHVVQVGETLWGLARLYLGDPFLWPEIYRINTTVVEDPHWIFPGEELVLVPADQTQVAVPPPAVTAPVVEPPPAARPPADALAVQQEAQQRVEQREVVELPVEAPEAAPPPSPTTPTVFTRGPAQGPTSFVARQADVYRGLRAGDFYGSGFLTENEDLPYADVVGVADLGTARRRGTTALIYQQLQLRAPQGAAYQVGDSLLTLRLGNEVPGGWGRVVLPTGVVRVVSVEGQDVVGELVLQFDQVHAGQFALPAEPMPRVGTARPQPVTGGIEGVIIARAAASPLPNHFHVVFLDLGRNMGVTPGDVFEVLTPERALEGELGPQVLAEVQVVHVRERSCTGIITRIYSPGIRTAGRTPQDVPVRLVGKMPA